MRVYLLYKRKSLLAFRKLVAGGGGLFDVYRSYAIAYLKYLDKDFDDKIAYYGSIIPNLDAIQLEQVFPSEYKWMIKNDVLKAQIDYIENLNKRVTEFKGEKEPNLKLCVGVTFLRLVLISKIVDMYLATIAEMKSNGLDVNNVTLKDLGVGKSILKYFDILETFDGKTIDDWKNCKIDKAVEGYFYSSMKRIMKIFTSEM